MRGVYRGERLVLRVAWRQLGNCVSPVDRQLRIVPRHPVFILGMMKIIALVYEPGYIGTNNKAMRETSRDVYLTCRWGGKFDSYPARKGGRTYSNIDDHVPHFTFDNA